MISFGGVLMLKFVGTCVGKTCFNANVSLLVGMWWSLDSESAMTLCLPGICCEYKAESLVMRISASLLAALSCD